MAGSFTEAIALSNAPPVEAGQNVGQNVSQGVHAGIQLATAAEQVQETKMKVADQKMELQQKQGTALMNRMTGALFLTNPKIASAAVDSTQSWADQSQIPFNGEGFKQVMADPNLKLQAQNIMTKLRSGGVLSSDKISELLKFGGSETPEMANTILSLNAANAKADESKKYGQETKIHGMDNASKERVAQIGAQAKVEVGGARVSLQEETKGRQEFARISNDAKVKPLLIQHQQGIKDMHTLNAGIDDPNGVPLQLISELGTGMGTMIANVKTGVSERQSQEFSNLTTKLAHVKSNFMVDGVPYVKDPVLLGQIKTQFVRLLDANEVNLNQQVDALERPVKNEYIAQQQKSALDNIRKQIKAGKEYDAPPAQSPTAGAPNAAPAFDAVKFKADQMAKGKDPAQIDAVLKAMGH